MPGKATVNQDIIMYRLDMLERRLGEIEKAMLTKSDSGINTELLNIILSMVKKQIPQQEDAPTHEAHQVASSAASKAAPQAQAAPCLVPAEPGASFMFNRRKTVV